MESGRIDLIVLDRSKEIFARSREWKMLYRVRRFDWGGYMRLRSWLWLWVLVAGVSRIRLAATPEEQYRGAMSLLLAGNSSTADQSDALNLLRLAADRGYSPAQTALGTIYEHGEGVMQDAQSAIAWYKKAADQGDWIAQFSLGRIYFSGDQAPRDTAAAKKWLEQAAGNPHDSGAAFYLGLLYDEGQGTATDYPVAQKWYRQSAERGNPFAMEKIALLLLKGGQKDKEEAYIFLLVAAEFGNHHADPQLLSMEQDLGKTGSGVARTRALEIRNRVQAFTQQNCGSWEGQYGSAPVAPPLSLQLPCQR